MSKPFRIALVGAGMITATLHLPVVLACPKAKITAIVDPDRERSEQLARVYGIDVLIAEKVDAVLENADGAIIATPNHTHKDIALACLNAGVATLIEKPLATSYAEGESIVQAAEKKGLVVSVGYISRFRENILFLEELLNAGHFGAVRGFARQAGVRGGWAPVSAYNLSRNATGGGVLVVSGTHFLDVMLHFWGYPDAVHLEHDSSGGVEAHCLARFEYETGGSRFQGTVISSKTTELPGGLVIETDRGIVVLADDDDADIVFYPTATPLIEQMVRRRSAPPYPAEMSVAQRQLEDFIDACVMHRLPRVDGRQGLVSLRLLEDLYSHSQFVPDDWYAHKDGKVSA